MTSHHGLIHVHDRLVKCRCGWAFVGPLYALWDRYSQHLDAA